MAQIGIREVDAKKLMAKFLPQFSDNKVTADERVVLIHEGTDFDDLLSKNPWLRDTKLVMKPDQLFGKRGKHGLVWVNKTFDEIRNIFQENLNKEVVVSGIKGVLTHFLIESFTPHKEEYYVSIVSEREVDVVQFSTFGGMEVEDLWDKMNTCVVRIDKSRGELDFVSFLGDIQNKDEIALFIKALYKFYLELNFVYLEINPFTFVDSKVLPLDCVAKVDSTGQFESAKFWGDIEFPKPFGRVYSEEERYIESLDEGSGASLKLTVLNENGRIWPMVAGGGASVIYADTVVDLGYNAELACYGEYSGGPSTEETKAYAETIFKLMTKNKREDLKKKFLLIGGGIANFTDVAATFKGIIQAMENYADKLRETNVKIYVRRGGPNYKEGLKKIKEAAFKLNLDMEVYGPEMHMTKIVSMALGE